MARKSFRELRNKMRPEARKRSRAIAAQMLLADLRKKVGMTQHQLAEALGIKQPSLSKLESQSDMQIKTLQKLIQALGGKLELTARMPDGNVNITQFMVDEID